MKMTRTPPGQAYSQVISQELLDAGKRASDIVNGHLSFKDWDTISRSYIAIRLSDGSSDGVLYDSKRDAVRHQLHEQQCAYVALRNLRGGAKPREMSIFLKFQRDAYDSGMRLTDPDDFWGGMDAAMTAGQLDGYRRVGRLS